MITEGTYSQIPLSESFDVPSWPQFSGMKSSQMDLEGLSTNLSASGSMAAPTSAVLAPHQALPPISYFSTANSKNNGYPNVAGQTSGMPIQSLRKDTSYFHYAVPLPQSSTKGPPQQALIFVEQPGSLKSSMSPRIPTAQGIPLANTQRPTHSGNMLPSHGRTVPPKRRQPCSEETRRRNPGLLAAKLHAAQAFNTRRHGAGSMINSQPTARMAPYDRLCNMMPSTSSAQRQEWVPPARKVDDSVKDNMSTSNRPPPAPPPPPQPSASRERTSPPSRVTPVEHPPPYQRRTNEFPPEWISLDEALVLYSSLGVVPKFDEFISTCERERLLQIPFWRSRALLEHSLPKVCLRPIQSLLDDSSMTRIHVNSLSSSSAGLSQSVEPITGSSPVPTIEYSVGTNILDRADRPASAGISTQSDISPSPHVQLTSAEAQNPILANLLDSVAVPLLSQSKEPISNIAGVSSAAKAGYVPQEITEPIMPASSLAQNINSPTVVDCKSLVNCSFTTPEIICLDSPVSVHEADVDMDDAQSFNEAPPFSDSVDNVLPSDNMICLPLSEDKLSPRREESSKPCEEMRIFDGKAYPVLDSNDIIVPVPVLIDNVPYSGCVKSATESSESEKSLSKEADSSLSKDSFAVKTKHKKRKKEEENKKSKKRKRDLNDSKARTVTDLTVQDSLIIPVITECTALGTMSENSSNKNALKSPDSTFTRKSPDSTSDPDKRHKELDSPSKKNHEGPKLERTGIKIKRKEFLTCKPLDDGKWKKEQSSKTTSSIKRTIKEFDMFAITDKESVKLKSLKHKRKKRRESEHALLKQFPDVKKCFVKLERDKHYDDMALKLTLKKKRSRHHGSSGTGKTKLFSSKPKHHEKPSNSSRIELHEVDTNVDTMLLSKKPQERSELADEMYNPIKPNWNDKETVNTTSEVKCYEKTSAGDSWASGVNNSALLKDVICVMSSPRTLADFELEVQTSDQSEGLNDSTSSLVIASEVACATVERLLEPRNDSNAQSEPVVDLDGPTPFPVSCSDNNNLKSPSPLKDKVKIHLSELQKDGERPKVNPRRILLTGRHTGLPIVTAASIPSRSDSRPTLPLKLASRAVTNTTSGPNVKSKATENAADSKVVDELSKDDAIATTDDKKSSSQRDARLNCVTYCGMSQDMIRQRRHAVDATLAFLRLIDLPRPNLESYNCYACERTFIQFSEWKEHNCFKIYISALIGSVDNSSETSSLQSNPPVDVIVSQSPDASPTVNIVTHVTASPSPSTDVQSFVLPNQSYLPIDVASIPLPTPDPRTT